MVTRVTDLHCKEVICISDGRRLGFICDVEVEIPSGNVLAIVVLGPGRLRIGPDIVLVDAKPETCRSPHPGPFKFLG